VGLRRASDEADGELERCVYVCVCACVCVCVSEWW